MDKPEMFTISRRDLLAGVIGASASVITSPVLGEAVTYKAPHLLSTQGCGRATGYAEANRIVTSRGKTHVAWLDSPPEGFRVRVATLDRKSGQWSPAYAVGAAKDNHGGPALTIDSEGYLHIAYFTHHDPFRYRRSKRPNDASAWEDEVLFGERLTYPTMICGQDNTLYFTARRSFHDQPWTVELWEKKPGRDWNCVGPIMHSRHKGYSHFQESLAWGPDHRTIHLCCRFHEKSDKNSYGRLQTVAYMKSDDFGRTWKRSNGSIIKGPITPDNIEVLVQGGEDFKQTLRAGCLAVSRAGKPQLIYSITAKQKGRTWLATPGGSGQWKRTRLNDHLPAEWNSFNLIMAGGLSFNEAGRLHGVAQLQTGEQKEKIWGDPTNEVVAFTMDGDSRIQFRPISQFDANTSHWLPSIERPTGHNQVTSRPGILFTAGPAGKSNTDLMNNRVYFSNG